MPRRLVATLDTEIAGRRYHPCAVAPGDVLRLRREPENPHDPNAILVETRSGQQAGYLPRRFAQWFASWLDGGAIETSLLVPFHSPEDARWGTPALVVVWAEANVTLLGFPCHWRHAGAAAPRPRAPGAPVRRSPAAARPRLELVLTLSLRGADAIRARGPFGETLDPRRPEVPGARVGDPDDAARGAGDAPVVS